MNICKIKFFITIVFTVILSGCVSTIPLSEQLPSPSYMPENKILLSVIDNREKIKSGKPENFVGVVHGAFGVPFDWHVNQALSNETEDKDKNLSEFIEHRLINGLKNKGWNVDSVKINSQVKDSEIEEVLANNDAQKLS